MVGFAATILIARALGPVGRGLYAYPVALLGMMVAFGHIGLEFAQIYLAGQGRDLRRMWANATVVSVVLGACAALASASPSSSTRVRPVACRCRGSLSRPVSRRFSS